MEDDPVVSGTRASSFETLYRAERPGMVRLAHLLTGSNAIGEEIVQDAFVELHRRWEHVDNPKAYLTRSVVNRTHSHHRRIAIGRRHPPAPQAPVLPPEVDDTWQALRRLPPKRRIALVLRYYEDRPIAEVAALMGIPVGTAKSLIHRGLKTLKEQLS